MLDCSEILLTIIAHFVRDQLTGVLKMKSLLLTTLLVVATTAHGSMKSEQVRFAGDISYSGFCKAVIKDDLRLLKVSVVQKVGDLSSSRKGVLRKLLSESGMTCNGQDLVTFSKQRDAQQVYAYLTQQD